MPQRPIQYADPAFERLAERRTDAAWLAARCNDAATQFAFLANRKHVVADAHTRWWPAEVAHAVAGGAARVTEHAILLGEVDGIAHFAIEVHEQCLDDARVGQVSELAGLRDLVGELETTEATALAYAGALTHWHRGHQFCPVCGAATASEQAGHVRRCSELMLGFWAYAPALTRGQCGAGPAPL
jgi:NAD+ diphosphatase